MQKIFFTITLALITLTGVSENEKPHFCTIDTSEHKENNMVYNGFFSVDVGKKMNIYKNDQYTFKIPNDSLKAAYMVILEVETSSPKNGVYEKMGAFYSDELHAPTTKKDAFEKGKYSTTWGFNKYIEVWYNGEYIKLIFPKLTNDKYETIKTFEHSFYVKKECYKDMLNGFKPKN